MNKKNQNKILSDEQVKNLIKSVGNIGDLNKLFVQMKKEMIESIYDEELKQHLGFAKSEQSSQGRDNYRNGSYSKTLKGEHGSFPVDVPRDRNGEFSPQIVPKGSKDIFEIENKIINLYGLGMSTRDITNHIKEMYGMDMSPTAISGITDKVIEQAKVWQSQPLQEIYPVVFLDGMVFKVKENNAIIKKTVYALIGINMDGKKEVLAIHIGEIESAKYWLSVLNNLRDRGVREVLIFCTDNLSGITQAVEAAFPNADHQKCIVHQIRNSLKHVSYKDMKQMTKDLKAIYTAKDEETGRQNLSIFKEVWDKKYPYVSLSWERNWAELATFWGYPKEIRRLIYTTNPIESFNRNVRKYTKTKPVFNGEDSLLKSVFLGVKNIEKKWSTKINNWGIIYSQLLILKEEILKN